MLPDRRYRSPAPVVISSRHCRPRPPATDAGNRQGGRRWNSLPAVDPGISQRDRILTAAPNRAYGHRCRVLIPAIGSGIRRGLSPPGLSPGNGPWQWTLAMDPGNGPWRRTLATNPGNQLWQPTLATEAGYRRSPVFQPSSSGHRLGPSTQAINSGHHRKPACGCRCRWPGRSPLPLRTD